MSDDRITAVLEMDSELLNFMEEAVKRHASYEIIKITRKLETATRNNRTDEIKFRQDQISQMNFIKENGLAAFDDKFCKITEEVIIDY